MRIELLRTAVTADLKAALDSMNADPTVASILVLACDADGHDSNVLGPLFQACVKPVFGGIFPQIVLGNEKLERGVIVAGLGFAVRVHGLEGLGSELTDFDEHILALFGEEDLRGKTMFVFVDGLSRGISRLVESLFNTLGLEPNYIGGGAGSLSFKQSPCLFCNQGMLQDAAILALADCPSSVGVAHGWSPVSAAFKVTEAVANTVMELDWKPAFQVYREIVEKHSGRSFASEPFFELAKSYPLGISTLDAEMIVRDPIILRDNGLVCVGEVPEGSHVHIMHGDRDSLIRGAATARDRALEGVSAGSESRLVIFIDCISRVLFLERDFELELGQAQCGPPLLGALTLGEIANNGDAYLQFYNKTSVIGIVHETVSDDQRRQILLELALSISGELDLQVLLGNSLPIFLRKLNCTSAGVLESTDQGLRSVMILPLAQQRSREWMRTTLELADRMEETRLDRLVDEHAGMATHTFSLPGFGLLVLVRKKKFDDIFIREFEPLVRMLARACAACAEVKRREEAEWRLARLQATQESLLDNLPFMAWMKDTQGRYAAVNKTFAARLGASPAEIIGRSTAEVWPAEKAQTFAAHDAKVWSTGGLVEGLDMEKDPDGGARWYEFSKRPIRGEDGEIIGTTGFRWEVTDRILAEQNLAYRTAFQKVVMDLAIEFVNTPLMELDQGIDNALAMIGGFAEVDRAYLFRYDFSARSMSNTHEWCSKGIAPQKDSLQDVPMDLVPDWVAVHSRGELVHVPDVSALAAGDPLRGILEPQSIRTLIALPLFHGSRCFGFAGFDAVRMQKNWTADEIALLKVMTVLLTNAEIRRLHEQRLVEAKAAAEAASLAKSEFLANMSHEIRTPLHGAVSMIDLLKGTRLNKEQREFLEMAESSTESLLNVINDILDFSKIEAGKLELTPRFFDLEDEVYRLATLVSAKAQEKNVEMLVRVDPAAPRLVEADNLRLRQVLSNLLFNAVKFTDFGHILLDVQCVDVEEGRVRLRFSVKDTGIGIPEHKLAIIFDQFAQVDGSASRRHGGTGLGLAICRQLVRLMGGSVSATSSEDKGSTFFFELELPWKRPSDSASTGLFTLHGQRALIVDDLSINRRILSEYLTAWGVEHDTVNGSLGALRMLTQAAEDGRPYSFMLLDHSMPDMDGLELARTLSIDVLPSSPRVILMTSRWGTLNADQCTEMGIWASLPKPVSASDLFNAIGDCLLGHRGQGCVPEEEFIAEADGSGPASEGARRHVLVVDDHHINRKAATLLLEKLGYRVSTAENGLEALDMARSGDFDMIFLDVQMPMMDGYETSRAIRAMGGKFAELPIIALTANAMESDRERCLEAGMTDYLPKPLPRDRLLAVLHEQSRSLAPEDEQSVQGVQGWIFHHQDFLARYDLEIEVAREILQDFLADGALSLADVLRAVERRDDGTVALAHRFKGPCSYVGAQRLQDLCTKMMTEAELAHWDSVDTLARDLASAWTDFTEAAQAWLDELEGQASAGE